ncbi:MAG: methyltransferase domain-containing protein [Actinomycetota bacterium]|nr:methyltransferase domain-containing protein [Actinomycetota bacterium]
MPPPHEASHNHKHLDTSGADLADLLDLDGRVLHEYWTQALTWATGAIADAGCERILDLGAGSGTGTIALAQRFGAAEVIAIDNSEDMLSRIRAKALDMGLASRIRTIHADLDDHWPNLDPIDITWASMSMHHMSDPDRVLSKVFAASRPGALVALAEFDVPLRFLPDDVGFGRPDLEARCLEALGEEHAHALPDLGSAWSPRLAAAGFAEVRDRSFTIDLKPSRSTAAIEYARGWLGRMRSGVAHRLEAEDQHSLDMLVGAGGLESLDSRGGLHIRGTRTITIGRRL